MKKIILFALILLSLTLVFVGCKGDGEAEETTAAPVEEGHEHAWGEIEVITAADCRYAGEGKRTCACGAEETVEIPALGHDVPKSVYVDNPTFTKGGVQAGTCTLCGKKIRSDVDPLKVEYKNVSANLTSVKNVYFNGYWTDGSLLGANGAVTDMLGSEIVAKATGASKLTYTFKLSDSSKSAVVAYSVDGAEWARKDLKENATLTVNISASEAVVRVMYVDTDSADQKICLTSVSADKGDVVPCVKKGIAALVISDKADNIEKDALSLTAESLGYTSWRLSTKGLGYSNFSTILGEYIAAQSKAVVEPEYILVDLGANDTGISAAAFEKAVSSVADNLTKLYPGVDIYFLRPLNGANVGKIETITTTFGIVSILDTTEWSATDASVSSGKLCEFLVKTYGEQMFFDGYYSEYKAAETPVFPGNKEDDDTLGELHPMN